MSLLTPQTRQYLIAGGALAIVGAPIVELVLPMTDLPAVPVIASSTFVIITLTVVWVRRTGEYDDGGSVWNAIPSSQYAGRFAEAGGLTRGEQEDALGNARDDE